MSSKTGTQEEDATTTMAAAEAAATDPTDGEGATSANDGKTPAPMHHLQVGLNVDVRDDDYIWCPAQITNVQDDDEDDDENNKNKIVKVHFEGWDASYDQRIPFVADRFAPRYAFTKRVKCLVDIISKKKGNPPWSVLKKLPKHAKKVYSTVWPCRVQFRMPHPASSLVMVNSKGNTKQQEQCLDANDFLAKDPNVFVVPYNAEALPKSLQKKLKTDGGLWVEAATKLHPWTDTSMELGVLAKGFEQAYELANKDTVGSFTGKAMVEKGCLLKECYRVQSTISPQGGSHQTFNGAIVPLLAAEELTTPNKALASTQEEKVQEDDKDDAKPKPKEPPASKKLASSSSSSSLNSSTPEEPELKNTATTNDGDAINKSAKHKKNDSSPKTKTTKGASVVVATKKISSSPEKKRQGETAAASASADIAAGSVSPPPSHKKRKKRSPKKTADGVAPLKKRSPKKNFAFGP